MYAIYIRFFNALTAHCCSLVFLGNAPACGSGSSLYGAGPACPPPLPGANTFALPQLTAAVGVFDQSNFTLKLLWRMREQTPAAKA